MARLITTGRFTRDYTKAMLATPEDREPAIRKLVKAAGGKFISLYFTTGDSDFMLIAESEESESHIAALLASAASGMISDVTTVRAWTGAEFKGIAEKASQMASAYRTPGGKS
jgi:uncharacterized protein with GYD domain